MKEIKFINSNILKILAVAFMLLDHIYATIFPEAQWMYIVGRLSFPIFAFLVVEGFIHTSDFKKYAKRLLLFGIISEIPFDLVFRNTIFYTFSQNVMFTLLLGLLCINEIDKIKNNKNLTKNIISIMKITLYCICSVVGFVDYGIVGILVIVMFYIFRNFKFAWFCQLILLLVFYNILSIGQAMPINIFSVKYELPWKISGVLALIFIWLYNGEKGKKNKFLQYSFYAFYPVHLLILYLIRYYVN